MADDGDQRDDFPLVQFVQGGPSQDGKALLVEATTAQGPIHFSIALGDVQHLVAFLLVCTGKMTALSGELPASADCRPIPATAMSVGEPDGDQAYLGVDVGAAELVFSLPLSAFDRIARTMLMTSAQPKRGLVT
jgi:hypothetical protein